MIDVIVACTENLGIGFQNKLPWKCPEELSLFSTLTKNSILIVGKNTLLTLPFLAYRTIYTISTKGTAHPVPNNFYLFSCPEHAIQIANSQRAKKVFVAGGGQLYHYMFTHLRHTINKLYLSVMKKDYPCDTFLTGFHWDEWKVLNKTEYTDFYHYELSPNVYDQTGGEQQYLNLLQRVLNCPLRDTRNGRTFSTFYEHLKFDLRQGFPLLTTKKMFLRGIIEELLFFWKGHTDTKLLEQKKVMIWNANTNREFLDKMEMQERKEGIMGPMYGYQWRHFNAPYNQETGTPLTNGYDQLQYIVSLIKTDNTSRRILMTDYNPLQASQGVLYPCHSIINQFYVEDGYLDMFCYNRSSDLFLGLPFNIAMYALFLTLVATLTQLKPRYLHIALGDTHIYEVHKEQVALQITRKPYRLPTLSLQKELSTIKHVEQLTVEDFVIHDYRSYSVIKAEMVT